MQNGEWIIINDRDYRLDTVLSTGAGSYGQVWAATDPQGRAIALKFINTEAMSQADPALRGHWRAHLEREIAFLSGLNAAQSRHVVALFDHGLVDEQPVLVLERLQANLGQWLAQQQRQNAPPDLAQIMDWAEQILDGLDVVHGAGFVYRDLKFSNLLVGVDGALLKLADFGSLKREDGDNTRSFVGTPATMAPEQVLPSCWGVDGCEYAVDYRADYYALGLLLFTLLTDRPTTAAQRRLGQLLALHGQEGAGQHRAQLGGLDDEEREALRRSIEFWTVPILPEQVQESAAARLTDLIIRLLARDPDQRPADSQAIRAVLDAVRADQPAALILTPGWNTLPPPAAPSNHWHRNERHSPQIQRRWALLAGFVVLVSAISWAIVRPGSEIRPDQSQALNAVTAPPVADAITKPAEPAKSALQESPAPPVMDYPEPTAADQTAPVQLAPVEPRRPPETLADQEPPAAVVTPVTPIAPDQESIAPARPKSPAAARPDKPRPARAVAAERPAAIKAPVVMDRQPSAPPRMVKPVPKLAVPMAPVAPMTPVAPNTAHRPPPAPKSALVARSNPVSSPSAPRAPATIRSTAQPDSVTRAEPRPRPAPPSLPPINLVSRTNDAATTPVQPLQPTQPASTAPAAPPMARIELVSQQHRRPPPTVAPTQSADPIRQFQNDAGRAATDLRRQAESFTRWVNHTSTTAGVEIRRSLETADRTMGRWTGNCNQSDGCGSGVPIERRDRWSKRYGGGAVSQNSEEEASNLPVR